MVPFLTGCMIVIKPKPLSGLCLLLCNMRELSRTVVKAHPASILEAHLLPSTPARGTGAGPGADWGIPLCLRLENVQA